MLINDYLTPVPPTPYKGKVKFLYVYYAPDLRIRDLDNMTAVVMKFANDSLVKSNFIIDDNTKYVEDIHLAYGGLDPDKFGHVDIHVFKND